MNREIKTTLAIDGERGFKEAMADASRQMRVLNSEMKATSVAFAGQEDSTEALTAKGKVLNAQIDQQKAIVSALAKAVEESADKHGEHSKKTDGYRIQLNNAQAALSKLENELGQTDKALNSFGNEMDDGEKKADKLHSALSKVGAGLKGFAGAAGQAAVVGIKAIAAATAAAAAGAAVMAKQAMDTAGEVQKFSDVTGQSAERVQELSYVGKQIDMDFETLISSQSKLTRGMAQAKDGNKAQAEAFKELGIAIVGADGKLRDSKVVMMETVDALGRVGNETERDAISLAIFGRSALDLNPLIKAGSGEISRLSPLVSL